MKIKGYENFRGKIKGYENLGGHLRGAKFFGEKIRGPKFFGAKYSKKCSNQVSGAKKDQPLKRFESTHTEYQ